MGTYFWGRLDLRLNPCIEMFFHLFLCIFTLDLRVSDHGESISAIKPYFVTILCVCVCFTLSQLEQTHIASYITMAHILYLETDTKGHCLPSLPPPPLPVFPPPSPHPPFPHPSLPCGGGGRRGGRGWWWGGGGGGGGGWGRRRRRSGRGRGGRGTLFVLLGLSFELGEETRKGPSLKRLGAFRVVIK